MRPWRVLCRTDGKDGAIMTDKSKPLTRQSGLWGDVSDLTGDCDDIPQDVRPCNIGNWVQS